MDASLERAGRLKQELVEFGLNSEFRGRMDAFVLNHPSNRRRDIAQDNLLIDLFLTDVPVKNGQTLLDLFLSSRSNWQPEEQKLLESWQQTFLGLFELQEPLAGGWQLMNWLSARVYAAYATTATLQSSLERLKAGDIILTRLAPLDSERRIFSGPSILLGNLSKPKLAVAVDNFRRHYKSSLYADAPELLAEAWTSVTKQHEDFVEFFGSDQLAIPGYKLNKKLAEYHDWIVQRQAETAGVDANQSLASVAAAAGVDEEELEQMAAESGLDTSKSLSEIAADARDQVQSTPKLEVPTAITQAEQVTVFSDPQWGQAFVPNYERLVRLLTAPDVREIEGYERTVQALLKDPNFPTLVWLRAAQQHPQPLESLLRTALQRPEFELAQLGALLQEFGKPAEPELPETASAPAHLGQLFQDAVASLKPSAAGKKTSKKKKKSPLAL
ncbi:hypothetical protein [Leptolyngbya sp. FACHB-261]|uniref:hypothetical protein n=1 Tax=Leptolyngbya sp. FACHB-261 TaxID=2692806 RepID=UPI00168595D2|nr:hypothetical protein [Leptolyngbya sp. FACHB-261]MBD2102143.1 hypothetical protein [Leptolyngbya sp. FACHB-261]